MISGGIDFTPNSDSSLQFTLTCVSTGGPATTVTWTRDSITVTEGTETVLDDNVTAQYTHTLTVSERLGGLYTCTVSNNKPSTASVNIIIQGNIFFVKRTLASMEIREDLDLIHSSTLYPRHSLKIIIAQACMPCATNECAVYFAHTGNRECGRGNYISYYYYNSLCPIMYSYSLAHTYCHTVVIILHFRGLSPLSVGCSSSQCNYCPGHLGPSLSSGPHHRIHCLLLRDSIRL